MTKIMGEVNNTPDAPEYAALPGSEAEGVNPMDRKNPHYMTPDEMREYGMKRVD